MLAYLQITKTKRRKFLDSSLINTAQWGQLLYKLHSSQFFHYILTHGRFRGIILTMENRQHEYILCWSHLQFSDIWAVFESRLIIDMVEAFQRFHSSVSHYLILTKQM
jgi:hypothetical protein